MRSLSSTEAEYIAISEGGKIIARLQQFLFELDSPQSPTVVYGGIKFAIERPTGELAKSFSKRKHVEIAYHFVLGMISRG